MLVRKDVLKKYMYGVEDFRGYMLRAIKYGEEGLSDLIHAAKKMIEAVTIEDQESIDKPGYDPRLYRNMLKLLRTMAEHISKVEVALGDIKAEVEGRGRI
jgi:L-alanine-DL-glutamate epimerase-like enolase superfamily enzyme